MLHSGVCQPRAKYILYKYLGDEITEINLSDEQKISLVDEIPSLLLNEAPLPVFSLRLFYQLILYAYADFANFIPKSGIIEVLITFVEMQSTEQSNQMLQKQLYPLLSQVFKFLLAKSRSDWPGFLRPRFDWLIPSKWGSRPIKIEAE